MYCCDQTGCTWVSMADMWAGIIYNMDFFIQVLKLVILFVYWKRSCQSWGSRFWCTFYMWGRLSRGRQLVIYGPADSWRFMALCWRGERLIKISTGDLAGWGPFDTETVLNSFEIMLIMKNITFHTWSYERELLVINCRERFNCLLVWLLMWSWISKCL